MLGGVAGCLPRSFGQAFAKPYDSRPNFGAADIAKGRRESSTGGRQVWNACGMRVGLSAGLAMGARELAVQMDYVATSGAFVEIVDILSNQSEVRYPQLHGGDLAMPGI